MPKETFVFDRPVVDRIDTMLEWFENTGRLLDTPRYRRQPPGLAADRRYTGLFSEDMSPTDESADVDGIEAIIGPPLVESSTDTIEVFNPEGIRAGDDDKCRFEFNYSSSQFEFYSVHYNDRRYTGLLTGTMSTGTASISVDNIATITGPDLVSSSTDTQTVQNTHGWEGDNNGLFSFEWNRAASQFEFYAGDCPST